MPATTSLPTVLVALVTLLKKVPEVANQINQRCQEQGLPPAFEILEDPFDIVGNPDYRFEGFGIVVGFSLKLSFWVHYKPESPEHVQVGRFLIPISLFELSKVRKEFKL